MIALDRYGHLSEEIFRACRLVVDTGMHALGWTRAQAVDYMLEHTAASKENIVGEVDRWGGRKCCKADMQGGQWTRYTE